MIIDAHQHFWNLQQAAYPWLDQSAAPICRTIEAADLAPLLAAAGIDKTVIIQAANSYEDTDYMLRTAAAHEWVGGVVGWVPLNIPFAARVKLEQYTQNPLFKGVRHLIHDEQDADWVVRDSVIGGLQVLAEFGMTFDVVAVFPNHVRHVPTLAKRIPELKMVIDHMAKPPIKDKQMGLWAEQMKLAAQFPNVYVKISGLNTAADWATWSAADLRPYIDFALEHFGAERMIFGSDWPVANLAGDYAKVWEETNRAISEYSVSERAAILGGTAAKFYNIASD